jgi:superkiller protein 3
MAVDLSLKHTLEQESEGLFRQVITEEGDSNLGAEACSNLGVLLEDMGMLEKARLLYIQAIAIDPQVCFNAAMAHSCYHSLIHVGSRMLSPLHPSTQQTGAHINLGGALDSLGDVGGAIAAYQTAIGLDPTREVAHYNLGVVLEHNDDLEGSLAAYQRAVDINPAHTGSHINIGVVTERMGDVEGAITAYRRAIAVDPDELVGHLNLGA